MPWVAASYGLQLVVQKWHFYRQNGKEAVMHPYQKPILAMGYQKIIMVRESVLKTTLVCICIATLLRIHAGPTSAGGPIVGCGTVRLHESMKMP